MSYRRFFTRKPIRELMHDATTSHDLTRVLGPLQLVLLGIGAIIGAGIFVLVGPAASLHAGPAITLSLALCGIACASAGLCYAELSSTIPISGGPYTYTYAALGEIFAWITVSLMLLTYILGAATVATGWSGYLMSFLQGYGITFPVEFTHHYGYETTLADGTVAKGIFDIPAFLIVALMTSIVYFGANTSAMVNAIIVIIKMTVIAMFIAIGFMYIDPQNWVPFIPENQGTFGEFGISGVISGAGLVFLAFTGFDAVATAAQETKKPQRDLPIGILGSLFICTLIYIVVSATLTGIVSYKELAVPEPMAVAVDKMNLPWFSSVIKIGAISGLTSVILVLTYGIVRILYTVTHDGLLPMRLAAIHKRYHTPYIITIIVGFIVAVLGSVFPVDQLAKMANFGTLSTFVMVCVAVIFLRYKEPNLKRAFYCPLVPWVPLFGIALFLVIIAGLPNKILLYGVIWVALMLLVYFAYGQRNSFLQKEIRSGIVKEASIVE